MTQDEIETAGIDAAIKNGRFLFELHKENTSPIIRGYTAGFATVLMSLVGAREAAEHLYRLADGIVAAVNIPSLMQSCHDDVVKAAKAK